MSQTDLIETAGAGALPNADRRAFFATALGAAAVGAAASIATPAAAQTTTVFVEVDVLNFALNIEYLQANFFSYATSGAALAAADISGTNGTAGTTGTAGAATGGRAVTFTDTILQGYAREMAADQLAHVRFLRTALSTYYAVAQPAIDLGTGGGFGGLWSAAGLGSSFDPYASENNFLLGAFMLKDLSVTAYAGLLPTVTTLAYVEAVSGIMAVEAHHAATLRAVLYRRGLTLPSLIDQTEAISAARDTLDGTATDLDQGVRPGTSASGQTIANLAPVDGNGIAFTRTPQQVLKILYVNAGTATSGGFFTAGMNGTIKSTATS